MDALVGLMEFGALQIWYILNQTIYSENPSKNKLNSQILIARFSVAKSVPFQFVFNERATLISAPGTNCNK